MIEGERLRVEEGIVRRGWVRVMEGESLEGMVRVWTMGEG